MKIRIFLFAQLKESCGAAEFDFDIPSGSKICDAVERVMNMSKLKKFKSLPLHYALNENFEKPSQMLREGDRLAILTPVAGG